jgi:hypothetical protein
MKHFQILSSNDLVKLKYRIEKKIPINRDFFLQNVYQFWNSKKQKFISITNNKIG